MKKGIVLQILMAGIMVFAVSSANAQLAVDSVCSGTTSKPYWVSGVSGSTYTWIINGGTQASGTNTDSITVDWSTTPGTDTLMVYETTGTGCIGDTQMIVIVRTIPPTATISGTAAMCYSDSTDVTIDLTGNGPWNVTYTDGTNPTQITSTSSQYVFNTGILSGNTTYTVTSVRDYMSCNGTTSGSASVTLNTKPTTSQIFTN